MIIVPVKNQIKKKRPVWDLKRLVWDSQAHVPSFFQMNTVRKSDFQGL